MVLGSIAELQRKTQANLITFLRVEIELAWTMLKMMNATKNAERKRRLLGSVQTALDSVHHFEKRITDRDVRRELREAASRLERAIPSCTV